MPGVLVDSSSPLSTSVHQNVSRSLCERPVIGDPPLLGMDFPFASSASSSSHSHVITRNGLSRLSAAVPQIVTDPAAGDSTGSGSSLDSFADLSGVPVPFQSNSTCSISYGVCSSPSAAAVGSPVFSDAIMALQKFLPSNNDDEAVLWPADALWPAMDAYSCDEFGMYEFKVRRCMRGRSHDWTECPFAHPGEKARRRDPRKFHYSGTACPDFRKGTCKRGDACEYAHGVFECWLHPLRYRTQPCKDGKNCKRRVCFFAHTVEQLRVPASTTVSSPLVGSPTSASSSKVPCYDGSPLRQALVNGVFSNIEGYGGSLDEGVLLAGSPQMQALMRKANIVYGHSPTSTLVGHCNSPPVDSPPLSPSMSPPMSLAIPIGGWRSGLSMSSAIPAHRRHLDRLRSVPMISIPSFDGSDFIAALQSPDSVNELVGPLQHLQVKDSVVERGWSSSIDDRVSVLPATQGGNLCAQHQFPQASDVPVSSTSATYSRASTFASHWPIVNVDQDDAVQRVESGRLLRSKIYGKIGMENGVASSEPPPDVDWVNELVE